MQTCKLVQPPPWVDLFGTMLLRMPEVAQRYRPRTVLFGPAPASEPNEAVVVPDATGPSANKNFVWWFNGQAPAGYPTTAKITLPNMTSGGTYTWTISKGSNELQFLANKSSTIQTVDPWVEVSSLGPSPPASGFTPDIEIDIVYSYVVGWISYYPPFMFAVREPYRLLKGAIIDTDWIGPPDAAQGYQSTIYYKAVDQFGKPLPSDNGVPVNEYWQAASPSTSNWISQPCGSSGNCGTPYPNDIADVVGQGEPEAAGGTCGKPAAGTMFNPAPINVQDPNCAAVVLMFSGGSGLWVGGNAPQEGVKVQSNTWLKYLDHGRHGSISSPPAE
jgi:hypothetical protein